MYNIATFIMHILPPQHTSALFRLVFVRASIFISSVWCMKSSSYFHYLLRITSCAGGMEDGNWGSRYPGRSQTPGLSRMMSDNLGHRFPSVANPRRQYSEDLYDAPRGSLNLLSGPGASPLDVMLGEADLGRSNVQQVLQNSSYSCTFTPLGNGIAKQIWPVSFML